MKTLVKKSIIIWATILGCTGADQIGKFMAVRYLRGMGAKSFFYDIFRLHYTENTGALLSLGEKLPEQVRFWLFTVAVFLLLGGLLIYTHTVSLRYPIKITGLAMIAGGGISNLIDRVIHNGAVTDFMNAGIGNLRTGIFNAADFFILAGIVLVLLFHGQTRGRRN